VVRETNKTYVRYRGDSLHEMTTLSIVQRQD